MMTLIDLAWTFHAKINIIRIARYLYGFEIISVFYFTCNRGLIAEILLLPVCVVVPIDAAYDVLLALRS